MMQDSRLLVSGAIGATNVITPQTVTGSGATVLSDYSVPSSAARDLGEGEELFMRTQVATAYSGGTSVEIQIVQADDAALSSGLAVLSTTGAIPVATLVAGYRVVQRVPPQISGVGKKYLGARYITVGVVAAGAVITDFAPEIGGDPKKFYPGGFTVK